MNEEGLTLEEYLIRSAMKGVTDHSLKAGTDANGNLSFIITDNSDDNYVCEFYVYGNILLDEVPPETI